MISAQMGLFDTIQEVVVKELPWLSCWGDWMPVVGGMAQIDAVFLPEYGYTYMNEVRILMMHGEHILSIVDDSRFDHSPTYNTDTLYYCKINELWPPVYHPRTKENGFA